MSDVEGQVELALLVADRQIRAAMAGLFSRPQRLGIASLETVPEIFVHPESDPGCLLKGADFLRNFANQYQRALLIFDRHGCGQEQKAASDLEGEVRRQLRNSGWSDRADVVVLDPELEVWVWSDSPHVERCLGWSGRQPTLRHWLKSNYDWELGHGKPDDPQGVLEAALREVRQPKSSSLFRKLAENVSLRRCTDPAFGRLRRILRRWFPP